MHSLAAVAYRANRHPVQRQFSVTISTSDQSGEGVNTKQLASSLRASRQGRRQPLRETSDIAYYFQVLPIEIIKNSARKSGAGRICRL